MSEIIKKILKFFEIEEVEQTGKPPAKTEVKPVPEEGVPEPSVQEEKPEVIEPATIGEEGRRRRIEEWRSRV